LFTARQCSPSKLAGFTLIELAMVLVVIGTVTAMGVSMGSSMIQSAQKVSTNQKLDAIETALMAYRRAYNRLPCPADPTLTDVAANSATFGYEAGAAGTCTATHIASYTIPSPGSTTNIPGGTNVVEGAVPVRTLNLPDEYQFDGWGRKFAYAVWAPITATATSTTPAAFVSYGITPSCGAITVNNAGGGHRTQGADYVLLSYGPDGHGGYPKGGGSTRYNAGSTNTDELTNAHYSNLGVDTGYAATYVQKDWTQNSASSTDVFDDIVRFKERWQMQNAYDGYSPYGLPCSPGFQINGLDAGDYLGTSVAVADINGDGIPDLIIGAPNATANGHSNAGKVYVIFGTRSGFPDPFPLSSLNGTNGFELDGAAASDYAGEALAVADVNGDGRPDIVIQNPDGDGYYGSVYVVFGGATRQDGTPWSSCPCALHAGAGNFLNGTNGAEFDGAYPWSMIQGSFAVVDVNGDGIADILVSGGESNTTNTNAYGNLHIIFGKKGTWNSSAQALNAGFLNGTNGVAFDGVMSPNAHFASSILVGDVNGDGIGDILVSCPYCSPSISDAGIVYVIYGMKSGWPTSPQQLTSGVGNYLSGGTTGGVEFDGTAVNQNIHNVGNSGDVNGDGINDILIGGPGGVSGTGFVIFGRKIGWTSPQSLNSTFLNGVNGVEFSGNSVAQNARIADVNGDGISDILFYNTDQGGTNPGMLAIIFGKIGGWPTTTQALNSTWLNGTNGVNFTGSMTYGGMNIGDVNGDGITDILVTQANNSPPTAAIVFGRTSGWPTSTQSLDSGSAWLNGTNGMAFDNPSGGNNNDSPIYSADINGDGIQDIIIPCMSCSPSSGTYAGSVYVYFGKKYDWPTTAFSLGGL